MEQRSVRTVITLVGGLALGIPASIGLLLKGTPSLVTPFPFLTIIPAFLLGSLYWLAVLIPSALFFAWNPQFFRAIGKVPRRSLGLLALATALTIWWFVDGWGYGVKYQGLRHTYAMAVLNAAWLVLLWLTLFRASRIQSFRQGLLFHWLLFAWLGWYAFPYLGELP
jgi:hypothetical protein